MTARSKVRKRHPQAWCQELEPFPFFDLYVIWQGSGRGHAALGVGLTEHKAWESAERRGEVMDEQKTAEQFRVLNIQRCAESIQLLYQTYIIDSAIAEDRGQAIQAINRMILGLGGEDTISKIEAVPYTARLLESGEPELVKLGDALVDAMRRRK